MVENEPDSPEEYGYTVGRQSVANAKCSECGMAHIMTVPAGMVAGEKVTGVKCHRVGGCPGTERIITNFV